MLKKGRMTGNVVTLQKPLTLILMQDLARAWKTAEQIHYGMIGINESTIGSEVAPFGGLKHSGLGKELSKYGIEEFLSIKYFCIGLGYNKSL